MWPQLVLGYHDQQAAEGGGGPSYHLVSKQEGSGSRQTQGSPGVPGPSGAEKLEEGNFKGAVRLACSEDSMADRSVVTFTALKEKHPSPHPNSCIPPSPDDTHFCRQFPSMMWLGLLDLSLMGLLGDRMA